MAENTKPASPQPPVKAAPAAAPKGKLSMPGKTPTAKSAAKPGTPNAAALKAQTPVKPKKPKKKLSGALVVAILFVLLIGAGFGVLYFDLIGARDVLVTMFALQNPTRQQLYTVAEKEKALLEREQSFAAKEQELADQETELADKKKEQEAEQKALDKELKSRESGVSSKEKELLKREEALTVKQAELDKLAASLEIRKIDISTAVQMIAGMKPDKAADALSGMSDPADIALLLLYMESNKSAAILDEMKTKLATSVMLEIAALKASNALPPAPSPTPSKK